MECDVSFGEFLTLAHCTDLVSFCLFVFLFRSYMPIQDGLGGSIYSHFGLILGVVSMLCRKR